MLKAIIDEVECQTAKPVFKSVTDLMTLNVRAFIEIKSAYEQCSPEIQSAVDEMIGIVQSDDATVDEKNGALLTIVEALFPSLAAPAANGHQDRGGTGS